MRHNAVLYRVLPVLVMAGCAQVPIGPTVQVMPGSGKSYAVFQADQSSCTLAAQQRTRGHVDASNNRAAGVIAASALAGAATSYAYGERASVGAAEGGATGAVIAGEMGANDQYSIQRLFDMTYGQCMFARGHQVEGYGPVAASARVGPDPGLVRAVQAELLRLGFLSAPPDGQYGGMTLTAIKQYEQANGMAATGYPTQRLLANLRNNGGSGGGSAGGAGPATAPSGWVAPVSRSGGSTQGASPNAGTQGSSDAAPSSSGWVAPTKTR